MADKGACYHSFHPQHFAYALYRPLVNGAGMLKAEFAQHFFQQRALNGLQFAAVDYTGEQPLGYYRSVAGGPPVHVGERQHRDLIA